MHVYIFRAAPLRRVVHRLLFCLVAGMLVATLAQGQERRPLAVEILGAGNLTRLLNEHLEIRRRGQDPDMSREALQRLVQATPAQIRELLATEGYFSPTIEHELVQEGGRAVARFVVQPGPPTLISSVDIRFTGHIAEQPHADEERMRRLRREWGLDPGERFQQEAWSSAKGGLLKDLLLKDYPAAAITSSEARIDPKSRTATLQVEVDSGPLFTFGELQVEGLRRYDASIIHQLNPIRPGEPYSQEKLSELQSRLEDTGYFRSAFATLEVDPAQPRRVPVRVDVSENPRKRLSVGIGFSTDAGARLQLRWLDRNFLERQWRLESDVLVDRETRRLGTGLFLPVWRNGWRPSYEARLERIDVEGEESDRLRLGARLTSARKTDEQSWGVLYLGERQRIGPQFRNERQALLLTYSYSRRRLDDILLPQNGYAATLELGAGPRGLVNPSNIGRAVVHATWLSSFGRKWQAVLRGQVGQVFWASRLDVPGELLFRAGGDQSVRGYDFNSLGVPQAGATVGGRVVAVASAELIYRLTPQWGAAVFTDAGNAADSWNGFDLKHGSGIGARWRSPIGRVNLDVAVAHETGQPKLHFSVGYGF